MSDVLDYDYLKPKENFTKAQAKNLAIILKKEDEIMRIQQDIGGILNKNDLNELDLNKYKRDKKIEDLIKFDFN